MSEVRLRWYSGKPAGAALPFGAAVRIDRHLTEQKRASPRAAVNALPHTLQRRCFSRPAFRRSLANRVLRLNAQAREQTSKVRRTLLCRLN